ncbi:hypothetical protein EVAR_80863_1 [Eumeta japonica]|uniref:Uncharacterized protein n=1 Tax=Eumeta variegata TaxID=151549 RepID=A0A4C1V1E3_EUMVA|nr:hypothetical protein EVAR_80863_1 [Eumeta japonica]
MPKTFCRFLLKRRPRGCLMNNMGARGNVVAFVDLSILNQNGYFKLKLTRVLVPVVAALRNMCAAARGRARRLSHCGVTARFLPAHMSTAIRVLTKSRNRFPSRAAKQSPPVSTCGRCNTVEGHVTPHAARSRSGRVARALTSSASAARLCAGARHTVLIRWNFPLEFRKDSVIDVIFKLPLTTNRWPVRAQRRRVGASPSADRTGAADSSSRADRRPDAECATSLPKIYDIGLDQSPTTRQFHVYYGRYPKRFHAMNHRGRRDTSIAGAPLTSRDVSRIRRVLFTPTAREQARRGRGRHALQCYAQGARQADLVTAEARAANSCVYVDGLLI